MTAREVAGALERSRQAGRLLRERPAAGVHAALADLLDVWSAADSPWQKALVEALPRAAGFSAGGVREGLARGLAPFSGRAFRALVESELAGARATGFETNALVLAGAIPMPTLLGIVAPLALRSPVVVKPSAADPVTAALVARSLAELDPLLGACVEVVDFRRDDAAAVAALCQADCLVANGSDEAISSLAHVQSASARPRRFVGYGHRFSLALLGPGATRGEALARAADGLALDIALWDQLGCLSPASVHAVDPDPRAADRVTEALAGALQRAEARWPRGRIDPAAAAAIVRERAEAEMRAAAAPGPRPAICVRASAGTAWTVVRETEAALRAAPLHRFARVHPAADVEACLDALRPSAANLAGVALAGFGDAGAPLAAALAELGASRVCAPGALQTPPLAWHRDNRGVLVPLARFSDIETTG